MVSVLQPVSLPLPVLPSGAAIPRVVDGSKTSTIYGLIREGQYQSAIAILTQELATHPKSRAAFSLLGHCYYQVSDFQSAAQCYQQLCELFPDVNDYQLYYAQSLYKAGLYTDALASIQMAPQPAPNSSAAAQHIHLQACIHYDLNDLHTAAAFLATLRDSEEVCQANACILYKQHKYEACLTHVSATLSAYGTANNDLLYLSALCHFHLHNYTQAMKIIHNIIENGVTQHPEFSVGALTDGLLVHSVGNSPALLQSQLIEAFNLKFAIDFLMKNYTEAKTDLTDMPYRLDSELDIITLHNSALINMDDNPTENLKKLNFILTHYSTNPHTFPREAFHNLLMFYLKFEYYDLCADIVAENHHLLSFLSSETQNFLQAILCIQSHSAESYQKLETLGQTYIEQLRILTKKIQDARISQQTELIKSLLKKYDEIITHYLPVLMYQCKIYWDREYYERVENILKKNAEFCSEQDIFQINVGHCFFMQDSAGGNNAVGAGNSNSNNINNGNNNKYKEAMKYYKAMIMKHYGDILSVTPVILANLCVSYIMCSENEEAEELMRMIEKEEEKKLEEQTLRLQQQSSATTALGTTTPLPISTTHSSTVTKNYYHLCIVNLVIGTLYCSKNNFDFGMSRIIKSFDDFAAKLNADTWYYAKKNILCICEYTAKNMLILRNELYEEIMLFLKECEKYGKTVKAIWSGQQGITVEEEKNNIAYEARLLQRMMMKLRE